MFVYTIKLTIKENLKDEFITYLYEEHMPDIVTTGCFLDYSLEVDITITNQMMARYRCENLEMFDLYLRVYANEMKAKLIEKYPDVIVNSERNFCKVV